MSDLNTGACASAAQTGINIGMSLADISDANLHYVKQLGVDWVEVPSRYLLESPPSEVVPQAASPPRVISGISPWQEDEIRRIVDRVEAAGLRVGGMSLSGHFPNALLGNPERDRDIENVQKSIRVAGRMGIPVLVYSFLTLRASAGYYRMEGRGGAELRAFDHDRIEDHPPLENLGEHSDQQMWERLSYFTRAVAPVAEEAGVRLSLHPSDPPVPSFRGVAQVANSIEGLKRYIEMLPSKAIGITLDTGVTKEMGADVVETIRYFGKRGRIHNVHFRNVRVAVPRVKYVETFIDEGEVDMFAAMKALRESGYSGLVVPDHTPGLSVDPKERYVGWAFALGYMKALLQAATPAG